MQRATYEDAGLIIKLYELRREDKLRKAREWFIREFSASSFAEFMEKYPPGSDQNAFFRMVTSYWEMAASFVVKGILHEELFFENNGEALFVFERVRPSLDDFRKGMNYPALRNLEQVAVRHIGWMNQTSPGAYEAFLSRVRATMKK